MDLFEPVRLLRPVLPQTGANDRADERGCRFFDRFRHPGGALRPFDKAQRTVQIKGGGVFLADVKPGGVHSAGAAVFEGRVREGTGNALAPIIRVYRNVGNELNFLPSRGHGELTQIPDHAPIFLPHKSRIGGGITRGGQRREVKPVSYTHLDVYKRQG